MGLDGIANTLPFWSGTTYSCVAVYEGNGVEISKSLYQGLSVFSHWILIREIVANEQGNRVTPSFVAFTEKERLIGDAAKNQAALNPRNTVFDAKYVPDSPGTL